MPSSPQRVLLKSAVPQQQVLPSLGWRGCIQLNISNSENTNRRASAFQGVLRVMQPCCCGDCGGCPPLYAVGISIEASFSVYGLASGKEKKMLKRGILCLSMAMLVGSWAVGCSTEPSQLSEATSGVEPASEETYSQDEIDSAEAEGGQESEVEAEGEGSLSVSDITGTTWFYRLNEDGSRVDDFYVEADDLDCGVYLLRGGSGHHRSLQRRATYFHWGSADESYSCRKSRILPRSGCIHRYRGLRGD